jgi:gluconate 5-dehydrogenase
MAPEQFSRELFSLKGNVVLVTGGSRGLGRAIGDAMARAGAHVVLNGRNPSNLDKAAREFRDAGIAVETACFDVTGEPVRPLPTC